MKEALLTLHSMMQRFHCKISSPCYNNLVKKIKYIFFMILFFTSSMVFAQSSLKQKTFGTFTIRFDTQKPELVITNTEDKTLVPKEYLEPKKSSEDEAKKEKPKSLAEKNLKKRTADDFTYADSEKTITIRGTMEELETIYNALNSSEDCYNFNLKKMGYDYASASSIHIDPETGKVSHEWSLIICELDWDDE